MSEDEDLLSWWRRLKAHERFRHSLNLSSRQHRLIRQDDIDARRSSGDLIVWLVSEFNHDSRKRYTYLLTADEQDQLRKATERKRLLVKAVGMMFPSWRDRKDWWNRFPPSCDVFLFEIAVSWSPDTIGVLADFLEEAGDPLGPEVRKAALRVAAEYKGTDR